MMLPRGNRIRRPATACKCCLTVPREQGIAIRRGLRRSFRQVSEMKKWPSTSISVPIEEEITVVVK